MLWEDPKRIVRARYRAEAVGTADGQIQRVELDLKTLQMSPLVHTAGAARVVEQIAKGEAEAVAAVIRERVEGITRDRQQPSVTSPAPAVAAPPVGVAAELRELAELRDAGVLTPQEFESQKARLLGR